MTTNKIVRKIGIFSALLALLFSQIACGTGTGTGNYSLTSPDQGNVTTLTQKAQCASYVGSDVQAGINCLVH